MSHRDQPCSLVGVPPSGCFAEQSIQDLGCVTALLEPHAVHGLDLSFPHPHRVRVVAHRGAEVLVPVDEMRPVNTRRNLDHDRPVPLGAKAIHVQTEHGREDSGDRGAAEGTLVCLIELTHIDPLGRRLLHLAHAEDDHPAAAVRHRGDVLGKSRSAATLSRAAGRTSNPSRSSPPPQRPLRHQASRRSTVPARPRALDGVR